MARLRQPPARLAAAPFTIGMARRREATARRQAAPWRRWYDTARWAALRMAVFARDRFTCQMCGKLEGNTALLVADHREAHRGDPSLFWDEDNIQTLCKSPCHDKHKQALEQDTRFQGGVWD